MALGADNVGKNKEWAGNERTKKTKHNTESQTTTLQGFQARLISGWFSARFYFDVGSRPAQ